MHRKQVEIEAKNIDGIRVFDEVSHLIQYADDTTLTLADEQSITNAMKLLNEFSKISGLNLNLHKCAGIWLGSFKNNPHIYSGIRFTNHPIKCLGIYIETDYKACEELNWGKKLKEIEDLTLQWRKRKLTLQGKITVINNLLIPKMIYPMTVLYTPPEVTKRIESIMYTFLWEQCHRVKKTIVTQENINGGLNMIDIQSKLYALKATWIPKFLNNRNRIAKIVNMYLTSINLNMSLILRTTFRKTDSFDIIKKLPMFYQQIFISLNECKTIKPINNLSNFEFLTQPLWETNISNLKINIYTTEIGLRVI